MKVLVCAATKYGATGEIAQAVADVLAEHGCEVTVISPGEGERGRGVRRGGAGQRGVHGPVDETRPRAGRTPGSRAGCPAGVAVFQRSGRRAGKPADNPVDVTTILQATGARDHRIFTGKLVKKLLSFPDRPWPQPSTPPRATSATGPTSAPGPPVSPTPCSPDDCPVRRLCQACSRKAGWVPARLTRRWEHRTLKLTEPGDWCGWEIEPTRLPATGTLCGSTGPTHSSATLLDSPRSS